MPNAAVWNAAVPDLNIEICGYPTAVSCAAGEEAHIHQLVTVIQRHADSAAQIVGPDRLRQLLFAALFLAEEATTATDAAPADTSSLAPSSPMPLLPVHSSADRDAALVTIATRLSGVADRLSRLAALAECPDA